MDTIIEALTGMAYMVFGTLILMFGIGLVIAAIKAIIFFLSM